jgi:DNA-binding NtrC family response regulator
MQFRILIVDDEEHILQALETFFSLRGFEVVTCSDPQAALERVRMEHFHVALLDINMPQMAGTELLRQIREARPTVQVIMMTAYTTIEKAIECVERGASDYFLKPFRDLDELAEIVKLAGERVRRWESVAKESLRNPKDVTAHRLQPGM